MEILIKIADNGVGLDIPSHATVGSAGVDLHAAIDGNITLKPMMRYAVPAGFSMAIPDGYEGEVRPRSGLAYKNGITVLNSPGTIDSDFRGELRVLLINLGEMDFVIKRGMRIAQLIIHKYEHLVLTPVESLDETDRSDGGYGSTGT